MLDRGAVVLHFDVGEGVRAAVGPISSESHWVWLRAPAAHRDHLTRPAVGVLAVAGGDPFDTMVLRVFLPMWIILVPVSACCGRS